MKRIHGMAAEREEMEEVVAMLTEAAAQGT